MALSNLSVKARYTANSSNKDFAIPGAIMVSDDSEVVVYTRDETVSPPLELLKIESTDYTLTGANPPTTPFDSNVRFNAAPTSGLIIVVYHLMPLTQTLDLLNGSNYSLENLELALDRIVKQVQQLDEKVQRATKFYLTSGTTEINIAPPVAGNVLAMNSTNTAIEMIPPETLGDSGSFAAHLAATYFGAEEQFTIANNQGAPTFVTDMAVASTSWKAAEFKYEIDRRSATQGYTQFGRIICIYDAYTGNWLLSDIIDHGASGPTSGVTFSIDSTGQVSYVSDDVSGGSYVGKLKFVPIYKFTKET